MRNAFHRVAVILLLLLILVPVPTASAESKLAVAALSLPPGSDGLLHWRSGAPETAEIQLSTRYFSEPMKMAGPVVQFFGDPVTADTDPVPEPLLSVSLPEAPGTVYLVLWSAPGEDGKAQWQSRLFRAADWKMDSLKVLNGCSENLGMVAGNKKLPLARGKSFDFHLKDWKDSFPVKIYRESKLERPVHSSTWRVGQGRRELCFLFDRGSAVAVRSLIDIPAPQPAP